MKIFDKTFDVLEKSMDLHFKRHSVLASNVANSETPGYKAREIDFAGELERALGESREGVSMTNPLHMDVSSGSAAHIVLDGTSAVGNDGNNVDLDVEMGKLSENSRAYSNATTWLGVELRLLKAAARGRAGQ